MKGNLATAVLAISWASMAPAATLVTSGGKLFGATGVTVNGVSYDVQFIDGTCIGVFNGCDNGADFMFDNATDANAAAQALIDQVFVDSIEGDFDSDPSLTFGCFFSSTNCNASIPWYFDGSQSVVSAARAMNYANTDVISTWSFDPSTTSMSAMPADVFARFTLAPATPAVPEPSSWALMLLGFGGVGIVLRRRRKPTLAQIA